MQLKGNIIANYLGQGWSALISLAFVPLYIKWLGIEAYGIIGFFVALQAWLSLLDMGMTPTLTREFSRQTIGVGTGESLANLLRTFEFISLCIAVAILIVFHMAAEWFARYWLNEQGLSEIDVLQAIQLMGWVAAFRVMEGIYRGVIVGLQKHIWLNLIVSGLSTLRAIGALLVLMKIESSIQSFFIWQAAISFLTILIFSSFVWKHLDKVRKAKFSLLAFTKSWKFAGGVFVTTALTLMITQIDKLILSKLLSLENFGIYMFSSAVTGVLFQLISPSAQAFYPKFSELIGKEDLIGLSKAYHQAAQLMTITLIPAGMMLVFFGKNMIAIWTENQQLSQQSYLIVMILSVGTILNGLMHIPYLLQLASGWTSLAVRMNLIFAIILVPAIFFVVPWLGAIGGALVWCAVNAGYMIVEVHLMHNKLLKNEKWAWYIYDIVLPGFIPSIIVTLSYFLHPPLMTVIEEVLWMIFTVLLSYGAAILSASEYRRLVINYSRKHLRFGYL